MNPAFASRQENATITSNKQEAVNEMKMKRVAAWAGIILLLAIYLITIVLGILGKGDTKDLLMAAFMATVLVPVILYGLLLIPRLMNRDQRAKGKE